MTDENIEVDVDSAVISSASSVSVRAKTPPKGWDRVRLRVRVRMRISRVTRSNAVADMLGSYETSTQSLTSTVQEYIFENGLSGLVPSCPALADRSHQVAGIIRTSGQIRV